jgi:hypothetical protein
MTTSKQLAADRIDAELLRLSNSARDFGLEELSIKLHQLRSMARREMSKQQLKDAPF